MAILASIRTVAADSLQLFRRLGQELSHDDYGGLAAQMTYYFMLGLFPILILVVGLVGLLPLDQGVDRVTANLISGLPEEVSSLLREFLSDFRDQRHGWSLVGWTLAALWAASRGFAGGRKGLDRIFKAPVQRGAFVKRAQDLLLTGACVIVLALLYALLLGGRHLLELIMKASGRPEDFALAYAWVSWPLGLAIGTVMVAVLYRVLPDRKLPWKALFAGAFPTMLIWAALTAVMRVWSGLLGDFDRVYGSLARFFLLMFVVWLYSLTLLLGAEIALRVSERSPGRNKQTDGEGAETVLAPE